MPPASRCSFGDLNIDDASRVTVQYNKATDNNGYNSLYGLGGGLVVRRGTTAKLVQTPRSTTTVLRWKVPTSSFSPAVS